jgi:hypothetical protein
VRHHGRGEKQERRGAGRPEAEADEVGECPVGEAAHRIAQDVPPAEEAAPVGRGDRDERDEQDGRRGRAPRDGRDG